MLTALTDLAVITFFVCGFVAVLGAVDVTLDILAWIGRRLRGLPEHDGYDRDLR